MNAPDPSPEARTRPVFRALLVGVVVAAYMLALGTEMPVYDDTTEDLLFARDGMALGSFEGGCRTTFLGFRQLELWVRLVAFAFSRGLSVVALHALVIGLWAGSLALFDRATRRTYGDDVGLPATLLLAAVMLIGIVYPITTQGCLGAPALVLSWLAMLGVVTRRTTLAATLAGASLALAAEVHPVTLLGAPTFVLAVLMTCERPIRALAAGSIAGVALAYAISPNAWAENTRALVGEPLFVGLVVVALGVALGVARRARPSWLAKTDAERTRLLIVGLVAAIALETLAASLLAGRWLLMPHYFLYAYPAIAVAGALGLLRLRARGGALRALALALPVLLPLAHASLTTAFRWGLSPGAPTMPGYTMREAALLARHFQAKRWSFADVQRHLRGPQTRDLLQGLAVFAKSPRATPERPRPDLRLLAFSARYRPRGPIPAGGESIDLGRGRRAWVLPIEPWVRFAPGRVCTGERGRCVDVASGSLAYGGRYRDLNDPALPAVRALRDVAGPDASARVWELPIAIRGEDATRTFELVGLFSAAFRVVRVEGVGYRGALPARSVVLDRSRGTEGRLVLAAARGPMTLRDYPPDFFETRPDEGAIRASLRSLPPLGRYVCASHGTCPDGSVRESPRSEQTE